MMHNARSIDDFQWKTTFAGRWPMMEDDLWWKTTYDGRRLMMEDKLWWKTTYDEGDYWWSFPSKEFSLQLWYLQFCFIFRFSNQNIFNPCHSFVHTSLENNPKNPWFFSTNTFPKISSWNGKLSNYWTSPFNITQNT